ncbi:MAG: discoidin domain-containing protein [Armatimonadetes bacterium]|nr:discoidin domain-containing protein [Armatimonadota bacterium]
MRDWQPMVAVTLVMMLALVGDCPAAVITGGGVTLNVDDAGVVRAVSVSGADLKCSPAPMVSLCDVTRGTDFIAGQVTGGDLSGTLELDFEGLDARAALSAEARDDVLHFTCELVGKTDLPARGVLLRFTLPVDCVGWRWHDDMQTTRTIEKGKSYENVRALRAWPDLPEWTDKPNLRIGSANRNFCTVVTGPAGLCLAPDIERPVIFRTTYDAGARQLQLVYDLALSPDTDPPNRWSFAFDIYACDANWGFRDALQRYYRMYPDLFRNYVAEPGQWMAFTDLKYIDNANEFHFGLQEGARDPAYDDKIGVLDCTYFTHAGQFIRIPGYDPEKDPEPAWETIVSQTEKTFEKRTGLEGIYPEIGLFNADGRFQITKTAVYGHYIAQFNLDPDLRYGRWYLDRTAKQTAAFAAKGGVLDGFYYDGLTTGLNYRTDHFKYSAAPPLWDPVNNKPVLNNFFNSCEFARAAAELLRPRGQITMMNGALGATFYVAPWLDVFGSETGLRISRESFNFIRTIIYHKPMLTLLKGNYEQKIGHDEMELFMKRALAYGIFPGFFDWPPSGLGPGGRYWDHPEYYERDRDLFRKYEPLVKTLNAAGWEPVTYARSSNEDVFVERFGPGEDGIVWLTLLNETAQPAATVLRVDAEALKLDPMTVQCVDVLSESSIGLRRLRAGLEADIEVPADGVMMLQLAIPERAACWRLKQAQDAVERGIVMRAVDAEYHKPALAVHWRAQNGYYGRERVGDGNALVFKGGEGDVVAQQYAMLFQPEAAPVTLRVRAAGEGLSREGGARILLTPAWVTKSFTHRERAELKFPEGTWDWRDFELVIDVGHPLRAIRVMPRIGKEEPGTLKIASITLEDRFGGDYVVDPTFEQWYEPVPENMRERLAGESRELARALGAAAEAAGADLHGKRTRDALLDAGGRARALREWIVAERAENGCRRALRDIETVEHHLPVALLAALGVSPPRLEGPGRAAPGDEVELKLVVQAPKGLAVSSEIVSGEGIDIRQVRGGARLTIPADARAGTRIVARGVMSIGQGKRAVTVRATHTIEVARPLELTMQTAGADPETGAFHVRAEVRNNHARRVAVRMSVEAPEGWERPPAEELRIAPGGVAVSDLVVTPDEDARAGAVPVTVTARAGDEVAQATKRLLYIPPSANLLRNPGFEDGPWPGGEQDTEVAYSGQASLRLSNPQRARSQASQTVTLNQDRPCPILVRCASRGQDVSGAKGRGYCLYVDIYYTDGTPLYGRVFPFETGTTDWQVGELIIEPEKPIRNVNVYLLLRDKSGTAWFDDVAVMEDPRRKGNIGREARVTVDSAYSGYDATPINDGIVHVPADAHWTEESWASADEEKEHWIELAFEHEHAIKRVVIYWSLDAGKPKTSREVRLQVPDGDGWRTVQTVMPAALEEETVLELDRPVTTGRLRLLQPAGRGPSERPNIMWVREVEVFEGG